MRTEKNKIKNLIKITEKIEGWLSVQEGIFLYRIANNLPSNANIAEIGSWKGKSTIWLASALTDKKGTKVYSIDPHVGSPEKVNEYQKVDTFGKFQENVAVNGLENQVISLKMASRKAFSVFKDTIDLLFIDGSHTYPAVKEDFSLWKSKMKKGGWIVMHDATVIPGVWKVARDNLIFSDQFRNVGMLGSMIFGQYIPRKSIFEIPVIFLKNIFSYLFIISYVKLRKIPFLPRGKKMVSRWQFKRRLSKHFEPRK